MATALDIFSGPHPGDPFIIVQPNRPYLEELAQRTGTLRVGVARTKWGEIDLDPEVLSAVDSTAALLEEMGHIVTEIEPPLEPEERKKLRKKILDGRFNLSAASIEDAARTVGRAINADTLEPVNLKLYEHSRNLQASRLNDVFEAFRRLRFLVGEAIHPFDILLTPAMPTVALPHGSGNCTTNPTLSAEGYMEANEALYPYLGVFNVTGHPAVSLPLAQSQSGLPIGLQIVGRFGDEPTLVRVARDLEEARPWSHRCPMVQAGAV